MEIKKAAVAGTMESSDVYVEIKPASDIAVQIESVVAQQFGEEIERRTVGWCPCRGVQQRGGGHES